MKCCDIEPMIVGSHTEVEGDNSPDTQTNVYHVLTYKCVNPQCENFESTWEEKIKIY